METRCSVAHMLTPRATRLWLAQVKIAEKIAAGANATVYRGSYLGVQVALKEIYYSVFEPQAVDSFR